MSISENIASIRLQIEAAAAKTGRTGADITLVGASKMNNAAACREAQTCRLCRDGLQKVL